MVKVLLPAVAGSHKRGKSRRQILKRARKVRSVSKHDVRTALEERAWGRIGANRPKTTSSDGTVGESRPWSLEASQILFFYNIRTIVVHGGGDDDDDDDDDVDELD